MITLFKQPSVENLYRDIAGFDMSHEELKELGRKAFKDQDEVYNYHYFERSKNKKVKTVFQTRKRTLF